LLKSKRLVSLIAVVVLTVCLIPFIAPACLRFAGKFLVREQEPVRADVALVLAGDPSGNRIRKAGDLARSGLVPKVLVSGPTRWYGRNEAELAIEFATSNGYANNLFEAVLMEALSTAEEARVFAVELKRRGIRKLLLVTSNYHTRRATAIFRSTLPSEIQIVTVGAPDRHFHPDTWWHTREGQKMFFFESSKTLATWIGL
jgi:uncharacterized SAM-binding protein YcdF (DUF218 family)